MFKNSALTQRLARLLTAKSVCRAFLPQTRIARGYLHIPNMEKERQRAEIQRDFDKPSHVAEYDKIYKPSQTIEFGRTGEVLLYSCDPFKHKTIFLKYPYVLFESLVPLMLFMGIANPLHVSWIATYGFYFAAMGLCFPRAWYLHSMQYRIRRMWLLRGGKFLKLERNSLAGDAFTNWIEIRHVQPLSKDFREFEGEEANFLTEEGQLKYELGVECEQFRQWGVNNQDIDIFFLKEGTVHQPELFEAVVKGYHIDTSDFVINTVLDERVGEAHHNY
jgi:hypothetical protein